MSPQPVNNNQKQLLKQLGEKIKLVRKQKGLTLEEVGNRIGKDRQSIHRLENGEFNPSYVYLIEVCKGLEIDILELLKDT
jgi:putative transcriptional regulator